MKKTLLLSLFLFCFVHIASAQKVSIRVFADSKVKEATFRPLFGKYTLTIDNSTPLSLEKNAKIIFKASENKVILSLNDSILGTFKKITLLSEGLKCFLQIEPTSPAQAKRRYDDNLIVIAEAGLLKMINNVETENYIAGVVQSETWGATTNIDFFKVQAICCRNYLLSNMNKHKKDGFNLCDGVHCQAYKTRANQAEVIEGAYKSKGEIIVDSAGNIIETPFHSNSGGWTVAAVDVWGKAFPYLVSVEDTFSLKSKNLNWEKFIKEKDWLNYFKDKGIDVKDEYNKLELLNFTQKEGRKKDLLGISLVQIRKDFGLKSTYFDLQPWGSEIKLSGKGYGHGVGMSQEGAIQMCDEGYEYWQVIEFYYPSSKVIKVDEDKPLK
jgi:stage II sporulation protein D